MQGAGTRWLTALSALAILLSGCRETDSAAGSAPEEGPQAAPIDSALAAMLPEGVTADMLEEGRQLFLPCAVCHGLDGTGNQLGPSLRDAEWTHIDGSIEQIERVVRDGIPSPEDYPVPMSPMGGGDFDAEELRAVSAYVFAISRP